MHQVPIGLTTDYCVDVSQVHKCMALEEQGLKDGWLERGRVHATLGGESLYLVQG